MSIPKAEAQAILTTAGLTPHQGWGLGDQYVMPTATHWRVTAYAPFEGNAWAEGANTDQYEHISVSLQAQGTVYKYLSLAGLKAHLHEALAALHRVAENEELLRCPECGKRWVHAKEPSKGERWKPFLSCDGMTRQGKDKTKEPACRGVSKKLPAVVVYR